LHYEFISVSEAVVCKVFPFTNLDFAYGGVFAFGVGVTYQSRFQKPNEVGFVSMRSAFGGKDVFREDGRAAGKGGGVKTVVNVKFAGGHVVFVGKFLGKGRKGFLGCVGK
jgi:hypothetical protein